MRTRSTNLLIGHKLPSSLVALVLCVTVLGYWFVGFYPFRFALPMHYHKNGAHIEGESIEFPSPGIAYTPQPPPWLQAVAAATEFEAVVDIDSTPLANNRLARILSISKRRGVHNLLIGQYNHDLRVRIRAAGAKRPRSRSFVIAKALAEAGRHTIAVATNGNELTIAFDGKRKLTAKLSDNPLKSWQASYRLALGNAFTFDRPWTGVIHHTLIRVDNVTYAYTANDVSTPARFFAITTRFKRQLRRLVTLADPPNENLFDTAINVLGFIPFTMLLMALTGVPATRAVVLGVALSSSIELGQFFLNRYPSLFDLLLNTLGSLLGTRLHTRLA